MGQDDTERLHDAARPGGLLNLSVDTFVPTLDVGLASAGLGLLAAIVGTAVAGGMRRSGTRVAYTRKVFHFVVFTAAAMVHVLWGLPGALCFGTIMAAAVLISAARGEGDRLYDALAREKDAPRQTLFILVPMVTTAVGGFLAAVITGPFATVGFLAAGWGDAVGEPAGARWGRHPYRVPSIAGVPATRTLEGSAAVWLCATLGSYVALTGMVGVPWWGGLLCGTVAALVEAGSNHGLDNLTVQLVPSLTAWLLFG